MKIEHNKVFTKKCNQRTNNYTKGAINLCHAKFLVNNRKQRKLKIQLTRHMEINLAR